MWNIFKHKAVENPKTEDYEAISAIENLSSENLEDSEPIDVRLEVLSNYLRDCESSGLEMTEDMVEKELENVLGIRVDELLDEQISDPRIKETSKKIAERIEKMMAQQASDNKTTLAYLRENVFKSNFAKAAFVTAMLFLKFAPAQASENISEKESLTKNKIESAFKKTNDLAGDGDKDYDSAEDFKAVDKKIKIEANAYFETDKADLKDVGELSAEFDKFLSSINNENFEKMMARDWVVKGSSDERGTSKWNGSNEELTKARIEAFNKVLQETLKNHDFSQQLSADKINKVVDKPITSSYPVNGTERGVTNLSSLINPDTENNYTDNELKNIKQNDPVKYQKLLDQCRYTNFETESSMFQLDDYDKCIILVDNSPSMAHSKVNMAGELKYVSANKPISIAYFSDDIEGEEQKKNSQEAAQTMMKMPTGGASAEKALSSASQYLEKIADSEKEKVAKSEKIPSKIMYVATDEGLQDANKILELAASAAKTNTDVIFLMFYEGGSKVVKLSLEELQDKVNKNAEDEIKIRQEQASRILSVHEEKVNNIIDKVIKNYDSNFGSLASALESCGIKGSASEIKKLLSEKTSSDLSPLNKIPLGKLLVGAKWALESVQEKKGQIDTLTVQEQIASLNLKINVLQNNEGEQVEFPISN